MDFPERTGWNTFARVKASQRWRHPSAVCGSAVTETIVAEARVEAGMHVLDIASGSGEPAISIAVLLNGTGHVVATDISPNPLELARERAAKRGLTNIEFLPADVHHLPFSDSSFDRVVCRFGVMFFSDIERALSEIRRVLKPGGRVTLLAWGNPDQPYFGTVKNTIVDKFPELAPLAAHMSIFRFAQAGSLTSVLDSAGFEHITEEAREVPWNWPDTPEELWAYFQEVTVPFKPLMSAVPVEHRDEVDRAIVSEFRSRYDGTQVRHTAQIVIASAIRAR